MFRLAKIIGIIFVVLLIVAASVYILHYSHRSFHNRQDINIRYVNFAPEKGTILRYEEFRGCKVPIKADGHGGEYRWIADVPWDKFTIEEKISMALSYGGFLSDEDIKEIKQKYGVK